MERVLGVEERRGGSRRAAGGGAMEEGSWRTGGSQRVVVSGPWRREVEEKRDSVSGEWESQGG